VRRETWMAMLPDIRVPWWARIGYHDAPLAPEELAQRVREAGPVWVLGYAEDGLHLIEAGEIHAGSADGAAVHQVLALYGPSREETPTRDAGLVLTALEPEVATDRSGERELTLDLMWVVTRAPEAPVTLFVHLYGPGGLVSQADGFPLAGIYPPTAWRAAETIRDVRHIPLPEGLAPGDYAIGVGIYDTQTGERLAAIDGAGAPLSDAAYRQAVSIP